MRDGNEHNSQSPPLSSAAEMPVGIESGRQDRLERDRVAGGEGLAVPVGRFLIGTGLGMIFALPIALALDLPIHSWVVGPGAAWLPRDLRKLIALSEVASHAVGAGLLLVAVAVLDRQGRRHLPRIAACTYGAAFVADLAKLALIRVRPHSMLGEASVWETFIGWFPRQFTEELAGRDYGSSLQSFPSGHTATAVGLAAALSVRYPHGRRLFVAVAILAAMQRIDANAHFFSDCIAGAAIGCLVAGFLHGKNRLARQFTRLERGSC